VEVGSLNVGLIQSLLQHGQDARKQSLVAQLLEEMLVDFTYNAESDKLRITLQQSPINKEQKANKKQKKKTPTQYIDNI